VILSNYDLNAPVKTRYDIYPPSFNVTYQYDWDNDGDSDYNYTYSYDLSADASYIEDYTSVRLAGMSNYAYQPNIDGLWMRDCFGMRELGYDDSWAFRNILYG
jgi:hypothetical protein